MALFSFENFPFNLRHKRQIIASVAAASGMLTVGSIIGWSSAALPSLKNVSYPFLRSDQESWIASIVPLAALIAGPVFGTSVDQLGRKTTMIITSLLAIFGWLIIGFAESVEHIYAGRFVTGICVGSLVLTVPIYVSDITEKEIRGTLASVVHLFAAVAILLSFLIGSIVEWQSSAFLSIVFPVLFLGLTAFVPESPRYFLDTNRDDDAERALCWLRGVDSPEQVKEELTMMKQSLLELKTQSRSIKEILRSRRILLPLITCITLMMLQQLTGYNAMLFYMVELFQEAGSTHPHLSTILVAIVVIISQIFSTIFMDTVGRKPFLLVSAAFVSLALFVNGTYLFLKHQGYSLEILAWLPLADFLLLFSAYSMGLGPVPFVIMSEILPNHIIGLASGLTTSTHFTFAFFVTRYFQNVAQLIGMHWTFWVCSFWALMVALFSLYFIPETKLKTLEEIQEFFSERGKSLGILKEENDAEEEEIVIDNTNSYKTFDNSSPETEN